MDERRFRRVPFATEAMLVAGQRRLCCQLLDIALKGALLESAEPLPLPIGTRARLSIPLPESTIELDFDVELMHREGSHYGVKFLHEDLQTLTHLRTLLELNTGDPEGVRSELLAWLKG
jgi:hypothetical protein